MQGDTAEQVKAAANQVTEQAGQMTDQVKEQASKVTDKAKDQATTRADEQKQRAADGIVGFAGALNQVSDTMRDQNPGVANLAGSAAIRLESFADSLRAKDVDELVHDVEDLARRQPALFIGGAFLAGVVAARFLKSSSGMSTSRGYDGYDRYGRGYSDYDTRGFTSTYDTPYGHPTSSTSYGSTYGATTRTTGSTGYGTPRGSSWDDPSSRTETGQTYSPIETDDPAWSRERGVGDSSSTS